MISLLFFQCQGDEKRVNKPSKELQSFFNQSFEFKYNDDLEVYNFDNKLGLYRMVIIPKIKELQKKGVDISSGKFDQKNKSKAFKNIEGGFDTYNKVIFYHKIGNILNRSIPKKLSQLELYESGVEEEEIEKYVFDTINDKYSLFKYDIIKEPEIQIFVYNDLEKKWIYVDTYHRIYDDRGMPDLVHKDPLNLEIAATSRCYINKYLINNNKIEDTIMYYSLKEEKRRLWYLYESEKK